MIYIHESKFFFRFLFLKWLCFASFRWWNCNCKWIERFFSFNFNCSFDNGVNWCLCFIVILVREKVFFIFLELWILLLIVSVLIEKRCWFSIFDIFMLQWTHFQFQVFFWPANFTLKQIFWKVLDIWLR